MYQVSLAVLHSENVNKLMKKARDMNISEKEYAAFGRLMNEEKVYIDPSVDFAAVCRWLGMDAEALDAVLREELGYGGDGLMEAYRRLYRASLSEKYGINVTSSVVNGAKIY